jgi:hypothetical protein
MLISKALLEIVRLEAEARHQSHVNHKSSRPLSEGYELIGLLGELEFAKATGIMLDLERKLDGDKGIDFIVPVRLSIDVKTARKAFNLIHEQGKPFADIYVLAQYCDDDEKTNLLGWEFGSILKSSPVKDFGYGIQNHYIPVEKLRPMAALIGRIR